MWAVGWTVDGFLMASDLWLVVLDADLYRLDVLVRNASQESYKWKSRLERQTVILKLLYHTGRHSIGLSTAHPSSQDPALFRFPSSRLTSGICPNEVGAPTVNQRLILKNLKILKWAEGNDQTIHSVARLLTLNYFSVGYPSRNISSLKKSEWMVKIYMSNCKLWSLYERQVFQS